MYNRTIRINPARPEQTLPMITAGRGSTVSLVLEGIPCPATAVQLLVRRHGEQKVYAFNCTKDDAGLWTTRIDEGFLAIIGRGTYEVTFSHFSRYWASKGFLDVVNATTDGIAPSGSIDPHNGHMLVTSVNGVFADNGGNVELPSLPNFVLTVNGVEPDNDGALLFDTGMSAEAEIRAQADAELGAQIANKADAGHKHDDVYAPIHPHPYAPTNHTHTEKQDVLTAGEGITIEDNVVSLNAEAIPAVGNGTLTIKLGAREEALGTFNANASEDAEVVIPDIAGMQNVCIGNGAAASGNYSTALGNGAAASGNYSTALGCNAKIAGTVTDAVQIGGGTNSTANTLQFRSYRLVGSDGTIPCERLPSNTVFLDENGKLSPSVIPDDLGSGGGGNPFLIYLKNTNSGCTERHKLTVTDSHGGVRNFIFPFEGSNGSLEHIVCDRPSSLSGFYGDIQYGLLCNSAVDMMGDPIDINNIDRDCIVSIGCYTCLAPDTLIMLADGMTKRVDELAIGDNVLSVDPETGELTTDIVCFSDSAEEKWHDSRDVWTFSDGTTITTVMPHQFFNVRTQKMEYIADFQIGDAIRKADGTEPTLTAHDHIEERTRHNTLYTAKYNNYFANGILTGNRHSVKWGWEWRKRNEPPPRVFSKMKVVAALMKAGLWEQVKAWIEQAGLYDLYLAAQNFAEDNEYFTQGLDVLKAQLALTDEQVDGILSHCIAD